RPQADARVQVHGPVPAPDVAPADVEKAARGELEMLTRLAVRAGGPELLVCLQAAAIADRRHRRLVHGHEHVLTRAAAVTELGDSHAAEEPQGAQRPLALVAILAAEWRARLEL